MTCKPCTIAETNTLTGHFGADCLQCNARAIAQSPAAFSRSRDPGPLQELMRKTWSDQEKYRAGRVAVWAWIGRFEQQNEVTTT